MKDKTFLRNELKNIFKIMIGCFIYSLSVVLFIDPAHIIPGSVTGIGVVVKALTGFPIGMLNLIVNIPLVIWATVILGKRILIYTGLTVLLNSLMMDGLAFLPAFTNNVLLASIFGGVVMGVGLGMLLDAGGSTGGTTIIGHIVNHKRPDIPMGNILMVGDFIIITIGSFFLKDWDLLLYSLIDLYVCVVVINLVMYSGKVQSIAVICSEKVSEIVNEIHGAVNGDVIAEDSEKVIVVARKQDISKIQHAVEATDQKATCLAFYADHAFGRFYKNLAAAPQTDREDQTGVAPDTRRAKELKESKKS
ncbi:YitT family protein [Pseudoramibacter faecis]|uniref:YitT family protein n=1 Tax=Pseudoramibacter faecis TaxID=3108534 RepID=UPI002E77471A|nr:YitT family protein [Pseudoramibacter sp. HA2172]